MISETAAVKVSDVLLAEPVDLEGLINLPSIMDRQENGAEAVEAAMSGISGASDPEARMAAVHLALGNRARAEELAAKIPNHPIGAMISGLALERQGKHEDALKCFQKAAQAAPTSAPFALKPIDSLRRLGRLKDAMAMAEKQKRQFADKGELGFRQGRVFEDMGLYQEALDRYEEALQIEPDHAECLFRAAYVADSRGLDEEAKALYSRIGAKGGRLFVNAVLNLAVMHDDEENYEQAIACCRRVLKTDPMNRRARLLLMNAESAATMYYSPEETKQSERLEAILRIPVSDFELSVRSRNCLTSMNIQILGDLVKKTESEMLAYKNFGETSLREIKEMLAAKGLRLGMMREDAATRNAMERQRRNASAEVLSRSIDEMELGVRARKCMESLGIATIGDLVSRTELELSTARNFGRVSLNEIKKKIAELGLSFRDGGE